MLILLVLGLISCVPEQGIERNLVAWWHSELVVVPMSHRCTSRLARCQCPPWVRWGGEGERSGERGGRVRGGERRFVEIKN